MIDRRSLQFDAYEYFKNCRNKRGVAVITDKQYIFYSQILNNDYRTHDNISVDIETTIHPSSNRKGWDALRENNVYVFAIGTSDFRIDFPDNGELSINQATFILKLLEQIDKYDKGVDDSKKVKLKCFNTKKYLKEFEQIDTSEIRKVLSEMITKKITIEDEKIIGETLGKEQIKSSLVFHIGLHDCTTIRDIFKALDRCFVYYCDSYYHKFFLELFPNYSKLINILNIVTHLDIKNEKVQNVSFENVYEIICNCIKNVFKNIKNYNELKDVVYNIRPLMKYDDFKDILLNFDLFLELILDLTPFNADDKIKLDNLISGSNNYDEMVSAIFKLGYKKKKNKLDEFENCFVNQTTYLKNIENKKNMIKNKDKLNDMIKKGNELRNLLFGYDVELGMKDYFIERETNLIVKNNSIIIENSRNFFIKIKERKKIKTSIENVSICESRYQKFKLEKEKIIKKRDNLKRELELIEKEFKSITHLDFLPFDEESMKFYYSDDYYLDESEIRNSIKKIEKEIDNLKKQLDNITQIVMIKFDVETLDVNFENKDSLPKINK